MANELYLRKEIDENVRPNLGQVGDVVQSMLTEAQLQSLRGSGWVLMDGRDVTGSVYESITGETVLPDARGQFLRGKNNGRSDGNENPQGDRVLGEWEEDMFQGHYHENRPAGVNFGGGAGIVQNYAGATGLQEVLSPIDDGVNGTPRTGSETAPKNITINYFIKIN